MNKEKLAVIDSYMKELLRDIDESSEAAAKLAEKIKQQLYREKTDPRVMAIAISALLVRIFVDWGFPLDTLKEVTQIMIREYKEGIKEKADANEKR